MINLFRGMQFGVIKSAQASICSSGGGLFTVVDTVRVFDDQHDLEVPPTPDATLMGHRDIILTQPTAAKDMAQFWRKI